MPPKQKDCKEDEIRNPKTGRCVKQTSRIGKALTKAVPEDKVLNPATGRLVLKNGKIGRQLVAVSKEAVESPKKVVEVKTSTSSSSSSSDTSSRSSPINPRMIELHNQQMEAMRKRDFARLKEIMALIEIERNKRISMTTKRVPAHLEVCKDSVDNSLPKLPTIDGQMDMASVIKSANQLIVIDNLCYDLLSLYHLIRADISQGNIYGLEPYAKSEGLILPFDKSVRDRVLQECIKRNLLPKGTRWENRSPENADDIELRGTCHIEVRKTPLTWLQRGWASDGSAFPTKEYYALVFHFPYRKVPQTPGTTAIFPKTLAAKQFIDGKLLRVYKAGALWSKKQSATFDRTVLNPNLHLIFEDASPNRWYSDKIQNLEQEILKFAPIYQ